MPLLQYLVRIRIRVVNDALNLVDHALEHIRIVSGTIEKLDVFAPVSSPLLCAPVFLPDIRVHALGLPNDEHIINLCRYDGNRSHVEKLTDEKVKG